MYNFIKGTWIIFQYLILMKKIYSLCQNSCTSKNCFFFKLSFKYYIGLLPSYKGVFKGGGSNPHQNFQIFFEKWRKRDRKKRHVGGGGGLPLNIFFGLIFFASGVEIFSGYVEKFSGGVEKFSWGTERFSGGLRNFRGGVEKFSGGGGWEIYGGGGLRKFFWGGWEISWEGRGIIISGGGLNFFGSGDIFSGGVGNFLGGRVEIFSGGVGNYSGGRVDIFSGGVDIMAYRLAHHIPTSASWQKCMWWNWRHCEATSN